ncbi:V-type proton ATPase subunit G [Rhodotorula toruloides]|nr:V-type proton ATPase subunit G [Rhodotorula toruloides]
MTRDGTDSRISEEERISARKACEGNLERGEVGGIQEESRERFDSLNGGCRDEGLQAASTVQRGRRPGRGRRRQTAPARLPARRTGSTRESQPATPRLSRSSSAHNSLRNAQGIATLLDAEKEASQIVAKAREYRNQRLKDARGEASKEIEQLRAKKEADFKEFENQHSGDSSSSQDEVNKATQEALAKIEASFEENREKVVKDLLERVVQVLLVLRSQRV